MLLTFDIGNSNIVICCAENGEKRCRFLLSSNAERTSDEYFAVMDLLFKSRGIELRRDIDGAIIASVVPALTGVLADTVSNGIGIRPLIVGPGLKSGLNIRLDDPSELGGDLVAAAVAAVENYSLPCAVVDMGVATAIGVVGSGGIYLGGVICPGVQSAHSSLAKDAAQLPSVSLDIPRRVIGRNTRESMQSGAILGTAAMLDGILERIEREIGTGISVVVTGAMSREIVSCCHRDGMIIDDDLVMRGLCAIYAKNKR